MNEDTKNLLKECTSGCKMAIGSMRQVEGDIDDCRLKEIVTRYKKDHEELERNAAKLLEEAGTSEKEPNPAAATFSWFTTQMKLLMEKDSHQIAKLMMDGCNMGIQSISEYRNKYTEASDESQDIAGKLVKLEEQFVADMKEYL